MDKDSRHKGKGAGDSAIRTDRGKIFGLLSDEPHFELTSNRNILIEGSKGVARYSPELIKINMNFFSVSFIGRGLTLRCISPTKLVIDGFICSIEFEV